MWRDLSLLTAAGLVFFWPLALHPGEVLYSDTSDFLAEHLPAKKFLVRSLHETGELPLWNPYQFCGMPFVHDIQVQAFYPPHAILYVIPEEWVGPAMSWLVVFHVLLAGWTMYGYARLGPKLGPLPALVAGLVFMFGGRWLLPVLAGGHTVLLGLAWLPLVMYLYERELRHATRWGVVLPGVAFALVILGLAPQWTFYAGIFVAVWTFGTALEQSRLGREVFSARQRLLGEFVRWGIVGAVLIAVALGLSLVQFLPTVKAIPYSSRAAGVASSGPLEGLQSLLFVVGPALQAEPVNLQWENRGGQTLLVLAAAVAGGMLARGRVRYEAWVTVGLFVFAFGGSFLVQWLPGFNFFRSHSRALVLAGFPVAVLAGHATQALFDQETREGAAQKARRVLSRLGLAVGILTGGFAVRMVLTQGQYPLMQPYWPILLILAGVTWWLLGQVEARQRAWLAWVWVGVLLLDQWALTWPLVRTRPESVLTEGGASVEWLAQRKPGEGRVLDFDAGKSNSPLGSGAPLAMTHRIECVRGCNPLDVARTKEYLGIVRAKAWKPRPGPGENDPLRFPVIEVHVNEPKLLDPLGVEYALTPEDMPPPSPRYRRMMVDADASAYDFLGGGRQKLPPYVLWRNPDALPRALYVPKATAWDGSTDALDRLTSLDFRREVLIEDLQPGEEGTALPFTREVTIRSYQPNRVVIDVGDGPDGWVVLHDVDYRGWHATIDRSPVGIRRANYLFRAVNVPGRRCQVVFEFQPEAYHFGRLFSQGTALVVGIYVGLYLLGRGLVRGFIWLRRR